MCCDTRRRTVLPEAINTRVASILSKLQARDRTQVTVIGLRLDLVSRP